MSCTSAFAGMKRNSETGFSRPAKARDAALDFELRQQFQEKREAGLILAISTSIASFGEMTEM